jgi:hypothetical protein
VVKRALGQQPPEGEREDSLDLPRLGPTELEAWSREAFQDGSFERAEICRPGCTTHEATLLDLILPLHLSPRLALGEDFDSAFALSRLYLGYSPSSCLSTVLQSAQQH